MLLTFVIVSTIEYANYSQKRCYRILKVFLDVTFGINRLALTTGSSRMIISCNMWRGILRWLYLLYGCRRPTLSSKTTLKTKWSQKNVTNIDYHRQNRHITTGGQYNLKNQYPRQLRSVFVSTNSMTPNVRAYDSDDCETCGD